MPTLRRPSRKGKRYGHHVHQEVRFCTSEDGTRLAYAVHGSGPPLVRVATWLTHLDFDWESPVWRHWLQALGERHTVIRYDERGCGLSDPDLGEPSLETWVADLEAVVDAAGLDQFTLLGVSQGAAIAVCYAIRHPERVSDLVIYGGFARGRRLRGQAQQEDAVIASIRAGWTRDDPTYRHVFSALFLPDGTPEQKAWYEDLLRVSTSAETAVQLFEARGWLDVTELAPQVSVRTLVAHARDDRVVPVEEGRLLAALIPEARLILLESANHILLADEPAWDYFVSELYAFLGTAPGAAPRMVTSDFSARELEVLELVAAGLANEEIGERLTISVRTVERHLSNVYTKLGVSGKAARAAAAVRFAQLGQSTTAR
jgi:pimeloyl-ACP methyl ester carboxylesterase/DNA-binding CsgD family transcriptional regulator